MLAYSCNPKLDLCDPGLDLIQLFKSENDSD